MKQTQPNFILAFILAFAIVFLAINIPIQPTEPVKQAGATKYNITELTTEPTTKGVDNLAITPQAEVKTLSVPTLERKLGAKPVDRVLEFLKNRKHRYTETYLTQIYNACEQDQHCLFSIVAISGQESSFGMAGKANDSIGANTNYWGFFRNGNRIYDPNQAEMAEVMGGKFKPSSKEYFKNIIDKNGNINERLARIYHGNDRHSLWVNAVSKFYKQLIN